MTAAGEPATRASGPATGAAGGRLYVVATPIGNLGDVTHRSLEVLAAVPLIAAEDTRIARRLLSRYKISTPLTSFHARSAASKLAELVEHLARGADLALVTDAGTPGVSDPGDELVRAWAARDGTIVPIPGASAVLAALVASGVAGPRWSFEGFLPRSGRERRERLARIATDPRPTVLFEAPSRVAATLADLATTCGPDRPAAVCRELTKIHEEFVRGSLGELAEAAREGRIKARGEFAIVVGPGSGAGPPAAEQASDAGDVADAVTAARAEVGALVASGVARGEAARRVAHARGIPRRRLYDAPDEGGGRR
ncbi:MAG TPA: 16S rRNA (cytidine(1402)-2'-O)-methyltransferase [Candidatus Limnocylindrales bacterium]